MTLLEDTRSGAPWQDRLWQAQQATGLKVASQPEVVA